MTIFSSKVNGLCRRGCYGIALEAPGLPDETLAAAPELHQPWPIWTLARELPREQDRERRLNEPRITSERADFALLEGNSLSLFRTDRSITIRLPASETSESLLHPWLSMAFATAARWRGGQVFHGGAVVIDGAAWGVLGAQGAGKTTTLAALAGAGLPVMADDLIAIQNGRVLVGPRFIDLRRQAAECFLGAEAVGRMAARHRWRLSLGPAPQDAPLAGWITLGWGDAFVWRPVPPADRLPAIGNSRLVDAPETDPRDLLELLAYPMVHVERPRDLARLAQISETVVDAARSVAPSAH